MTTAHALVAALVRLLAIYAAPSAWQILVHAVSLSALDRLIADTPIVPAVFSAVLFALSAWMWLRHTAIASRLVPPHTPQSDDVPAKGESLEATLIAVAGIFIALGSLPPLLARVAIMSSSEMRADLIGSTIGYAVELGVAVLLIVRGRAVHAWITKLRSAGA